MRDPRLTWAIGIASLFVLFPFACRLLVATFDGAVVVMLMPLGLYYMLPASLFGASWFDIGNLGITPASPMGHVIAALVWGGIGAVLGFANGQCYFNRARAKTTDSGRKAPTSDMDESRHPN